MSQQQQTEEQLKARTFEVDGLTLHNVIEYLSTNFVHKQIDGVINVLAQLKEVSQDVAPEANTEPEQDE